MNFWRDVLHLPSLKLILAVLLLFTVRLIVLTALEKRDPAHVVAYREVLPRDFFAMLVIGFGVATAQTSPGDTIGPKTTGAHLAAKLLTSDGVVPTLRQRP